MAWLGLGALVLIVLLLGARFVAQADPGVLARATRYVVGGCAGALAILLVVMGRVAWAVPLGALALSLLGWREGSMFPGASGGASANRPGSHRAGRMSRQEALDVLGLDARATAEDIKRAHRELIQKLHPDRGGSTHLAAEINEAKDVLLGNG